MDFVNVQRPGRGGSPLRLAAAVVAVLVAGGCSSYDSSTPYGGDGAAEASAVREVPEWLREVDLRAPPGARREADPDESPYFWQGAPVELVLRPRDDLSGRLVVTWRDRAGEVLSEQNALIGGGIAGIQGGTEMRFAAPAGGVDAPGEYLVEVAWDATDAGPLPAARLSYAIGEPPPEATPGGDFPAFPWPPPQPTSRFALRTSALGGGATPPNLGLAADRLLAALDRTGYSEHSFYALRPDPAAPADGFALVTRLEQIRSDGTPRDEPERWSAQLPPREIFSLSDVIEALFQAPEGHYRVIVFLVTGAPVVPSGEAPSRRDAGEWLGRGMTRLPRSLGELRWTRDHACTALVYQFRQVGAGSEPQSHPPGAPSAREHLERTGLLAALAR